MHFVFLFCLHAGGSSLEGIPSATPNNVRESGERREPERSGEGGECIGAADTVPEQAGSHDSGADQRYQGGGCMNDALSQASREFIVIIMLVIGIGLG